MLISIIVFLNTLKSSCTRENFPQKNICAEEAFKELFMYSESTHRNAV